MPTLDLRFPPEVRLALERFVAGFEPPLVHPVAAAAEIPADADEDFAALWHEELAAGIDADTEALRALLARPDFGRAPLTLGDDEALAALRGFTVMRLLLRSAALGEIPDERLEQGAVDRRTLDAATRHAYACYGALGDIQEALCASLDD